MMMMIMTIQPNILKNPYGEGRLLKTGYTGYFLE